MALRSQHSMPSWSGHDAGQAGSQVHELQEEERRTFRISSSILERRFLRSDRSRFFRFFASFSCQTAQRAPHLNPSSIHVDRPIIHEPGRNQL